MKLKNTKDIDNPMVQTILPIVNVHGFIALSIVSRPAIICPILFTEQAKEANSKALTHW
jgi:hypothetical protein